MHKRPMPELLYQYSFLPINLQSPFGVTFCAGDSCRREGERLSRKPLVRILLHSQATRVEGTALQTLLSSKASSNARGNNARGRRCAVVHRGSFDDFTPICLCPSSVFAAQYACRSGCTATDTMPIPYQSANDASGSSHWSHFRQARGHFSGK